MKPKGNVQVIIVLILIGIFLLVGYFAYKNYGTKLLNVLPTPISSAMSSAIDPSSSPVVTEPKSASKVISPLTIRGTVPPGWMFEGVFPIKLVDSSRNVIVQGQASEEVPGAWQSNTPTYFSATLTFTTSVKSGFIILENDNPSGDPSKSKTFEVAVTF